MLVLGIETSTPQTSVALGTEQGTLASMQVSRSRIGHEVVTPAIRELLRWSELELGRVAGIAVGIGPGLFTSMRVGIATARALAQVLRVHVVGLASLDTLAFSVRYTRRVIASVVDARRGEVFYAFYRPTPGGVTRETTPDVGPPEHLVGEIQARRDDILLVGGGALAYRRVLEEEVGPQVEFASPGLAFPHAAALVELAIPRFFREEAQRPDEIVPLYVRRSDAEIAWDRRARSA